MPESAPPGAGPGDRHAPWAGRPSIRRSMVAWLLVPLALLVPAVTYLFYRLALVPAHDSLDRSLDGSALALERLVDVTPAGVRLRWTPDIEIALRADRFDEVYWVVRAPDGAVLGGDAQLMNLPDPRPHAAWAYSDADYRGQPVRVATHSWSCDRRPHVAGQGECIARVAETRNKGNDVQREVLAAAAVAMLIEALVLGVTAWFAIARSLRPVEQLSRSLERRAPDDLGPLDRWDIPREVAPLVTALNGLFMRARSATAAEKAFLADAAHQLRTPLTALQTETELALMVPQPPEQEALLRRLHRGTMRAARLAHQLLAQARTEHDLAHSPRERLDLKQIAASAVEEWVGRSVDHGIDLGFELEPAPVDGHAFMLRELLANLLHNALNYAGRGARVTVRTRTEASQATGGPAEAVLEVEDNGPGITPEVRERAFERFQRGQADGSGSGLGLSIVRDIVRSHQGRVELLDGAAGIGLRVRVSFPLPAAEPSRGRGSSPPAAPAGQV